MLTYLGTHGMAHGLDFVLEAADRLRHDRRLQFAFVGDGAEKPALERLAQERQLDNVAFLPPMGKDAVVGLYAASDICLVPLRKVDLFTDVLPSKLFEIMGMQRAMILSVDGDAPGLSKQRSRPSVSQKALQPSRVRQRPGGRRSPATASRPKRSPAR